MSQLTTVRQDLAPGGSAPVLDPALLARIHDLNLDYLDLLASEYATPGVAAQLQHLPASVRTALAELVASARRALAAAPLTLYSLGFEDEGFWRAACEIEAATLDARYASSGAAWLQGPFCEAALLCAWHIASFQPLAARMLYAMPEASAQRLAATPVWRIKRIAGDYPALLAPRWPTNPSFWPGLARFAAAGDAPRLRAVQLLGHQLIAAELEHAAASRGACAEPPLRSPRLRARKVRFELRAAKPTAP